MADESEDVFGDPALFAEFEKPQPPSDTIMLDKFKDELKLKGSNQFLNGKESENDDSNSESEDWDTGGYQSGNGKGNCEKDTHLKSQPNATNEASESEAKLQIDLEQLKEENRKLSRHSRLIDPNKYFQEEEGPALQILFLNHGFARKYRADIERFLLHLVERDRSESDYRSAPVPMRSHYVDLSDKGNEVLVPEEKIRRIKSSTVIGASQVYREFAVDCMGWPLVDNMPALSDSWDIPQFEQVYRDALPEDEEEDDLLGPPKKEKRPKPSCFNCGGNHMLSECKEKKDMRRINEKKREFMSRMPSQQASLTKPGRYHIEDDPRFVNYKAGQISDSLRKALGIRPNELPPYIYQMRFLGYPPGHLKHAEVQTSGIALFDTHGKEVNVSGEAMEDGELDTGLPPKVQHDFGKLISYPGFNVDPPKGTIDEWEKLRMIPMQPQHQRRVLEAYLTPKREETGTKRQLSSSGQTPAPKRQRLEVSEDMDLDDDNSSNSEAEKELSRKKAKRPDRRLEKARSSSIDSYRADTPSLEELEQQQALLLQQLQSAEGEDSCVEIVDSCESDTQNMDTESVMQPPLPKDTPPQTPPCPPLPRDTPPPTPPHLSMPAPLVPDRSRSPSADRSNASTPQPLNRSGANTPQFNRTGSLGMQFGTPLVKEIEGKQETLPDPDKWADGITEHLPFENLPNATGTFKRMRGVLEKVRSRKQ